MKKIIVTFLVFLVFGTTFSFANSDPDVDPMIVKAFQKEFSFAENVKWEKTGELAKVSFSINDQGFYAWYNANAELVTTARNMLYMQLPLSVIKTLNRDYSQAELSGIVEFTKNGETFYHINANRNKKKYLLKATIDGNITQVKRLK